MLFGSEHSHNASKLSFLFKKPIISLVAAIRRLVTMKLNLRLTKQHFHDIHSLEPVWKTKYLPAISIQQCIFPADGTKQKKLTSIVAAVILVAGRTLLQRPQKRFDLL